MGGAGACVMHKSWVGKTGRRKEKSARHVSARAKGAAARAGVSQAKHVCAPRKNVSMAKQGVSCGEEWLVVFQRGESRPEAALGAGCGNRLGGQAVKAG